MSDDISSLKEAEKQTMAGETAERPARSAQSWIPGLALLILGVIFLVGNLTGYELQNWWALFILIPALVNFGNAWQSYKRHGRFGRGARSSFIGGLILTIVAATFLFDWEWDAIWPLFLILAGVGILLGRWFD